MHSWAALGMQAVVMAGVGLALIIALLARDRPTRTAAGAMFAAAEGFFAVIAAVSWVAVPIALVRTTFPTFVPLLGAMALSAARCNRERLRAVGTVCCLAVVVVWLLVSASLASSDLDRRPNEQGLFTAIAERLGPADVLIVFSPEMQASAGYFLRHHARAAQIHCTDVSRLEDGPDSVGLRPVPREPDADWFERFRRAADEARARHPHQHAVWLMDLGPRSSGDPDRRRVLEWLDQRYVVVERITVGQRWPFSARRYLPIETNPPGEPENENVD